MTPKPQNPKTPKPLLNCTEIKIGLMVQKVYPEPGKELTMTE